jgi:PilZ domain
MRRNGKPQLMLWPKSEERRQAPRYPLERLAKIQIGSGTSPRYCLVIDISGGGVRINGYGFDIPDEFVLLLSGDGPAKDGTYRVIWRFAHEIGAKFIGPADPAV